MQIKTEQKQVSHPLDNAFDIVPCGMTTEYKMVVSEEPIEVPSYDSKDQELDSQFQEVYDTAMSNCINLADETEVVEGKYKARMGEVTATMLTVALNAAMAKSQLKIHKDKLRTAPTLPGAPNTVNNNLIVTDRNEILRLFKTTPK